jgi:hypothetical protein
MPRLLTLLFVLVAATASAGCTGGACGPGGCSPSPAIGVSPYEGRYIEGGHGWR